ncbi:hypothetical protein ASPZODRAFT_55014 [Penicilliopsis zonata CBS 506.65]|uniref:Short chain dehydrogenase/reductase family n=1 Tax=Penicilliopsis zonata CBS 506.65 TaxID=1073090 RepID=A0A1L9SV50_9EURO|nr:hypothetical protein ASPZODRAFT_55014 [Penicilliopsis zonata CBS 506.65]OJJ50994.1 hypothetical protein ASPZODRAFT_55014 [Penicilliopsis zonata CBS 506.65]
MAHLEASKLFSVEGLVAVITGGGSGLGRSMALALDANGASKVFIIGRREEVLKETAAAAKNKTLIPIIGDITSKESLEAAYDAVASQTDRVHLLVANSGIMGPMIHPPKKPDGEKPTLTELRDHLWQLPMDDFSNVLNINVTGTYYTVLAFLPLLDAANKNLPAAQPGMLPPPKAQVVVTSSIAGYSRMVPFSFAYSLSKAAATHLIKMLSTLLSQYAIRVNGLAPGLYHSELAMPLYQNKGIEGTGTAEGSFPREAIPVMRGGGEEDMAGLILWLAGAAGGYINGNIVVTDGGRLSLLPSVY